MRIIVFLLFIMSLNVNAVRAEEKVFFMPIPSNVSVGQAVAAVTQAALNRGWSVEESNNEKLQIKLHHRLYKAILDFSFSNSEIYYSDHTTYFYEGSGNSYDNNFSKIEQGSKGEWKERSTPKRWIKYLKNDTARFILSNKMGGDVNNNSSNMSIEEKLGHLKKMYEDGLITESEYKLKRTELLSKY